MSLFRLEQLFIQNNLLTLYFWIYETNSNDKFGQSLHSLIKL